MRWFFTATRLVGTIGRALWAVRNRDKRGAMSGMGFPENGSGPRPARPVSVIGQFRPRSIKKGTIFRGKKGARLFPFF